MKTSDLTNLALEYRRRGVVKGAELLLRPDDALALSTQLAELNVLVVGCDGWRYVDRDKTKIVQDLGVQLSVEEFIPYGDMDVEESAKIIEQFVQERVPSDIDLISLQLDDPRIADLFVGAA